MEEAVGDLAVINGRYAVFDRDDENAIVVCVFSQDEKTRDAEIGVIVRSFDAGNGTKLELGKTIFNLTYVWRGDFGNNPMLKKQKNGTKMMVVKNKYTKEFFLVMDDSITLPAAKEFVHELSMSEPYLLRGKDLSFSDDIQQRFEGVIGGGLVVIKLAVS